MNDVLHGAFKLVKAVRAHRQRKRTSFEMIRIKSRDFEMSTTIYG